MRLARLFLLLAVCLAGLFRLSEAFSSTVGLFGVSVQGSPRWKAPRFRAGSLAWKKGEVRMSVAEWREKNKENQGRIGALPFGIDDVLLPGETKQLHLYEARFLALFEEVVSPFSPLDEIRMCFSDLPHIQFFTRSCFREIRPFCRALFFTVAHSQQG
jgi:hypothetical protein